VRLPPLTLVGLLVFLAGTVPGSLVDACPTSDSAQPAEIQDTARLLDPLEERVRRGPTGAWLLPEEVIEPRRVPFEDLDLPSFYQMLRRQPELLGPASVGSPVFGALLNGQRFPSSPTWQVQVPDRAWGTPELVSCLERSVAAVQERFPGSPVLQVGDLSRPEGGFLRGHKSHQSGLDADIGYYYHGESAWYLTATEKNLDRERTWALVRALVTDCSVEYLFVDMLVLVLIREHAEQVEEDQAWVASLFARGPSKPGIIRHVWGHRTHMHVRIHDGVAEALGERIEKAQAWAKDHPTLAREVAQGPRPNW
jgi:murein endopeptidase